jgi:HEPN domain-containing protein
MPDRKRVLSVVGEWTVKADNDLKTAAHTLKLGEGIDFPKTHDLERLVAMVPARVRPKLSPEEQGRLTDYATGARYPGWGEIPLAEARRAVAVARCVRREIRIALSDMGMRRSKR